MNNKTEYLQDTKRKLLKAIVHLEYSYDKIQSLPMEVSELDEEQLETWESFASRFSRVSDMFLSRYLRTRILLADPGFSGSLIDYVNAGEKIGLIDDATAWLVIRGLRNVSAHDYSEAEINLFFAKIKQEAPRLLVLKEKL